MAKEFKRVGNKDFRGKKSYSSYRNKERSNEEGEKLGEKGEQRTEKHGKKPFFERFRDESRPSDFGSSKGRTSSGFDNSKRKSFSDKPVFKKKNWDGGEKNSFSRSNEDNKSKVFDRKSFDDKPIFKKREESEDKKPSFKDRVEYKRKPFEKKTYPDKPSFARKNNAVNPNDIDPSDLEYGSEKPKYSSTGGKGFKRSNQFKPEGKKFFKGKKGPSKPQREHDDGLIRLNKYLSNAGICSRREADDLISSGVVQVNGKTITEMGFRVKPTDIIKYGGQTLKKERLVYFILNKPKDYITTADDPQNRKTVLELMQGACRERIYPVGRLDRATTGLLMFTNDGDLTKKLTHPRFGVRKIYHVELNKPLKHSDLDKIAEGIELEDGPIKVDEISYAGGGADKTLVGVEIHSGKNRIVRRIFEHMGYNVRKLDRVMFGSLTKKDLPRGRWRLLTEAEVGMLKMISGE